MVVWIKRFLIFFPLAMVALFVASFLTAKAGKPKHLNQLTVGTIGEAENLNPILATTTAASEIDDFIFNGLLRYDENLNLIGDLASSWKVTQVSTFFFRTPEAAQQAATTLKGKAAAWVELKVTDVAVASNVVRVKLTEAGTSAPEKVQQLFKAADLLTVAVVRVDRKDIDAEFRAGPGIYEVWQDGTSGWELTVPGDPQPILSTIAAKYPNPSEAKYLKAEVTQTVQRLDEPEVLFELRPGVRWQDGAPFTAEDVAFTYQMLMDEEIASPRRSDYELVKRVEVTGPLEAKVIYRRPFSPCLNSWMMPLLPKHILAGHDSAWWAQHFNRQPVGTGPFKFDTWKVNQYVRLAKNPDYYEGAPHLDAVVVRTIPDMVSLRICFETRQIDFWGPEPYAVSMFETDPRFDFYSQPVPSYDYVGWNLRKDLFEDVKVRQALAHAVNVPKMIQFIFYGHGEQSRGTFPNMMWFADPNIQPFAYDPALAEKMLDEAGWRKGPDGIRAKNGKKFQFMLITNHPNEERKDIATLVQSDLKRIGVSVDVQLYEWAVFITQHVEKFDFDAMVLGWSLGYDYDQYQLWHSSQTKPGMLNHCGYKNPKVDGLLDVARSEFDRDKIKSACQELQRQIYQDQPYMFLVSPNSAAVVWKKSFQVRRPDGRGGWITEPIRQTKAGFRYYNAWWERLD
ncbi:MAG: hypothetical protein JO317_04895 [Verrucomicrobiae bacterium]|nr:hypothetical protein [Verrucomicrobiae bacterium]